MIIKKYIEFNLESRRSSFEFAEDDILDILISSGVNLSHWRAFFYLVVKELIKNTADHTVYDSILEINIHDDLKTFYGLKYTHVNVGKKDLGVDKKNDLNCGIGVKIINDALESHGFLVTVDDEFNYVAVLKNSSVSLH